MRGSISGVAAATWGPGRLDLFWRADTGELWDRYWDGISWHEWESLGGELSGDPAASSSGANRVDVYAPGRDGRVWHRWWDGTRWVEWEQLDR
jgi:hypothetical protein